MPVLIWPQGARATPSTDRIISSVNKVSPGAGFSTVAIAKKCGADVLCTARLIANALGPKARLEKVRHPNSDQIRRVRSRSSLTGQTVISDGMLHIALSHFGRKAGAQIKAALRASAQKQQDRDIKKIRIDLRQNPGGRFDRMLKLAAAFIGPIHNAVGLRGKKTSRMLSLSPSSSSFRFKHIELLIGPQTASSAEIFASLLRVHGNARIIGKRSYGKDYLQRIIAINHDWQLLVPAETVFVPGINLTGGLVPD